MQNRKDLVILVTGASSGIGQRTACHLAECGYKVYGTSRHKHTDDQPFAWVQLDVNSKSNVDIAIQDLIQKEGHIDVLINNAGLGMISSFEEAPEENIKKVMETNFGGVLRMIQAILPIMRSQNSGKILNITSLAGSMGLPYRSIYSASKFAVEGLTEALRGEVSKFNIEVCTVQPGSIRTDIKANRVSHLPIDSSYHPELGNAERMIDQEVNAGIDAQDVAELIEQIIRKRKLALRYIVAKPLQKFGTTMKRYFPRRLFEWILVKRYQ